MDCHVDRISHQADNKWNLAHKEEADIWPVGMKGGVRKGLVISRSKGKDHYI